MSNVKIFVSVRDRHQCSIDCIESLIETTKGKADVYIFDNESDGLEFRVLTSHYLKWSQENEIAHVTLNRKGILEDVYWSKNFAWTQFLAMMEMLPDRKKKYLVMVDSDVIAKAGWLENCIEAIESPEAKENKITIVSPYDGYPRYGFGSSPTRKREGGGIRLGNHSCMIRSRMVSRFWFARYDYWKSFSPPPFNRVIRQGKLDRVPTDVWYWDQMIKRGEFFGALENELAHDPPYKFTSSRMLNKIGADT